MAMTQFLVYGAVMQGDYSVFKFVGNGQGHGKEDEGDRFVWTCAKSRCQTFLAQFSRKGAAVPLETDENEKNVEAVPGKLGLSDSFVQHIGSDSSALDSTDEHITKKIMESKVCFTHFGYLGKWAR